MRHKLFALLLAGLTVLLAGCSLARPEAENSQDRFCGFFMTCGEDGPGMGFYDNPNLTEMGAETLDAGEYGRFSVPRQVLVFNKEARTFPGMEGYSLFIYRGSHADGSSYIASVSDMGEPSFHTTVTDQGNRDEIEGTVYMGPPLGAENWDPNDNRKVWHAYRVYQAEDGTVYLDGSGNSYGGAGGMSTTETASYTSTENGETVSEDSVSVTVHIEVVPRLEELVVSQFGDDSSLLRSDSLSLTGGLPAVTPEEDAAWLLVEERFGDGTVERAAYNVPNKDQAPIFHSVVLLDKDGAGEAVSLEIGPSA